MRCIFNWVCREQGGVSRCFQCAFISLHSFTEYLKGVLALPLSYSIYSIDVNTTIFSTPILCNVTYLLLYTSNIEQMRLVSFLSNILF